MGKIPQAKGAQEQKHRAWDSVAFGCNGDGAPGLVHCGDPEGMIGALLVNETPNNMGFG